MEFLPLAKGLTAGRGLSRAIGPGPLEFREETIGVLVGTEAGFGSYEPECGFSVRDSDPEAQRSKLHLELDSLATRADQLERDGEIARSGLRDVAEAQENADRCDAESVRLDHVAVTIDRTIALLEEAQTRVHRDLAPVLVEAIRPHFLAVTGGRYVDVRVDAATLELSAKESPALGGRLRKADYLSRGTREQAYLLLRAAMAKHLVTTNEVAPLILDEVTAQSDEVRTVAILTTLHELSADRQIVLFSHDPAVASWARVHLIERDLLVEMQPIEA